MGIVHYLPLERTQKSSCMERESFYSMGWFDRLTLPMKEACSRFCWRRYRLEETDWQWIKRMASRLGEPIFAGIYTNELRMEVGLSEKSYYEADEAEVVETKIGKTGGQPYRGVRTGENWNPGKRYVGEEKGMDFHLEKYHQNSM